MFQLDSANVSALNNHLHFSSNHTQTRSVNDILRVFFAYFQADFCFPPQKKYIRSKYVKNLLKSALIFWRFSTYFERMYFLRPANISNARWQPHPLCPPIMSLIHPCPTSHHKIRPLNVSACYELPFKPPVGVVGGVFHKIQCVVSRNEDVDRAACRYLCTLNVWRITQQIMLAVDKSR